MCWPTRTTSRNVGKRLPAPSGTDRSRPPAWRWPAVCGREPGRCTAPRTASVFPPRLSPLRSSRSSVERYAQSAWPGSHPVTQQNRTDKGRQGRQKPSPALDRRRPGLRRRSSGLCRTPESVADDDTHDGHLIIHGSGTWPVTHESPPAGTGAPAGSGGSRRALAGSVGLRRVPEGSDGVRRRMIALDGRRQPPDAGRPAQPCWSHRAWRAVSARAAPAPHAPPRGGRSAVGAWLLRRPRRHPTRARRRCGRAGSGRRRWDGRNR